MYLTRNLICVSLAMFLASCPGDEQTKADSGLAVDDGIKSVDPEVEAAMSEVAGEIDSAAQEAAAKIDESNADDMLEQLSKELDQDS